MSVTVDLNSEDEITYAREQLENVLKNFKNHNEEFYFEAQILNGDIPCYIMLDWSIEDYEKDVYSVAHVTLLPDTNKEPNIDKFVSSESVDTAKEIVQDSVYNVLGGTVGTWETYSENPPDLIATVVYNPANL